MGAGKTTIGRYLAEMLHWQFLDSDHEIESRVQVPVFLGF
jgi:shikimate kinase